MKASEYIAAIQKLIDEHGDLEVITETRIASFDEPYLPFVVPDETYDLDWIIQSFPDAKIQKWIFL